MLCVKLPALLLLWTGGCLGVVTQLTVQLVPSYDVHELKYYDIPCDHFIEHFFDMLESCTSFNGNSSTSPCVFAARLELANPNPESMLSLLQPIPRGRPTLSCAPHCRPLSRWAPRRKTCRRRLGLRRALVAERLRRWRARLQLLEWSVRAVSLAGTPRSIWSRLRTSWTSSRSSVSSTTRLLVEVARGLTVRSVCAQTLYRWSKRSRL